MLKRISFTLMLLLISFSRSSGQKDKHSARFGDLSITATAMESSDSVQHRGDRHKVYVYVIMKNNGKKPACAYFAVILRATYGLQYRRSYTSAEPRVREMLPGEESSGRFVFDVKDGVQPIELALKLDGKSIRCGSARDGSFGDVFLPEEVKLDVHDLPPPSTDEH